MARGTCIWCRKESSDTDVEHIFPEALGCPAHLTLPGHVVCKQCNNGLAHLDQAVADDFDFLRLMHGVKRKGGRPAEVNSRGNVYATQTPAGPNIFFNLDPIAHTAPTGQRVAPFRGGKRDLRPLIEISGTKATVEVKVPFGQDKKFARGLYKIALNSVASMLGADAALAEHFNWLRHYVTNGGKQRRIMLRPATPEFKVGAFPPWKNARGDYAIEIRIAIATFLLDLSEDESLLPVFEADAKARFGGAGYSILPAQT